MHSPHLVIAAVTKMIEAAWDTPARSAVCALAEVILDNIHRIDQHAAASLAIAAGLSQHSGPRTFEMVASAA